MPSYTESMQTRPLVHFHPQRSWMNDPNGCFFYDKTYHLYFQHNPFDMVWGPMHWGHATSSDLVNWDHKPIAIHADGNMTAYSGSIVIDTHNVSGLFSPESAPPNIIAFYTRCHEDKNLQEQCLAYSLDGGTTFLQYHHNPIIANPNIADFRDPKVDFHALSQSWIMVLAVSNTIHLYRSANLLDWELVSTISASLEDFDGAVECPDFFQLPITEFDGKNTHIIERELNTEYSLWVLTCSFQCKELIPSQRYKIGTFDGSVFTPISQRWEILNYGIDAYASQTWHHPTQKHEKTQIAWSAHWSYANNTPMQTYRGIMTFPSLLRIATYGGHYHLCQRITPSIYSYAQTFFSKTCSQFTHIPSQGDAQLVEITIQGDQAFSVSLFWSDTQRVDIDVNPNAIVFDRSKSDSFFEAAQTRIFTMPILHNQPGNRRLTILIDYTIVELFMYDRQVGTYRVFPECKRLQFLSITPHTMESIDIEISKIFNTIRPSYAGKEIL